MGWPRENRPLRAGRPSPATGDRPGNPVGLRLGFGADDFSYAIDFGLPAPSTTAFARDPEIRRECIWSGPVLRPAALLCDRHNSIVRLREDDGTWSSPFPIRLYDSMLSEFADPRRAPEVLSLRERIRSWRFYDHFRTDATAPARRNHVGTRTPVLGRRLDLRLRQHGLLRPLGVAELSDGTLRYLLWIAALLTPRPPGLLVLNEPETSLHFDLLTPLAELISSTAAKSQIIAVSHSRALIDALSRSVRSGGTQISIIELAKDFGETHVVGQEELDQPAWHWPKR